MKRKIKYGKHLPRLLYTFFVSSSENGAPPSFEKFARSIGATLGDVEAMRVHKEFDRAYRESSEIRRDCLIDGALLRRYDPSFTKFLLAAEFGMGDKATEKDDTGLEVTLKVLSSSENEA